MRLWPFGKGYDRKRQESSGYTAAIVHALHAHAAGDAVAYPAATAALEAAAGAYSRAFAVAEVTPQTATTRAITPALLALAARSLIRSGEFVWAIHVDETVRLMPASSWDISVGAAPDSWHYRVDLGGPSGTTTRRLPAGGVVHGQYSVDPVRPWIGISPLGWASLSGRLHGAVEDALADESAGTRGHILPVPQGPDGGDDDEDPLADLRADIANLRGRTVIAETVSGGWGEGVAAAPKGGDYRPSRIGAAPPAPLVDLRSESARAVLAACGLPSALYEAGGDAAGKREAWRLFLHGAVQPVADLLAAELAAKLDAPGLRLGFDRLFASDRQGRARAYQSLTGGGMETERAAQLAGLT